LTERTPLRVVTEGILTRQLVADPSLDGTAVVVLDEFHERSLDADLSLAMLREAKLALRDDLRIVVMSATLDAAAVATYLGEASEVETLEVPGRLFPVDVEYAGTLAPPMHPHVTNAIRRELDQAGGDILVFLPGAGEIERVMRDVGSSAHRAGFDVLPLHGGLSRDEQDAAVREGNRPRVICATNIAETSLTLHGVRVVIDSGQVRQAGYDAARGVATLSTRRISKASAEQRAGRAGRVADGRCVRLWSKVQHAALDDFDTPEVKRVELS
ncbi:MAG: helicase-related protein, partial [Planctomycetota bacterium]